MLTSSSYRLSRPKLLQLLDELKASPVPMNTLCLTPGNKVLEIEGMLRTTLENEEIVDISKAIAASPTGAVLFWSEKYKYLVLPPFPMTEERAANVCEIEPLSGLLHREFTVALVLVRLGEYAIGVFKGEKLLSSKIGTGLVHARHRQGGSSSHRFERHREKQMETFFTRICVHVREQLEPYHREIEFVIYGGTKETLLDFRKQCHFLQGFDSRTLDLRLNVRVPKQATLENAITEAWSSQVYRWLET
jgi:hypothetical protein